MNEQAKEFRQNMTRFMYWMGGVTVVISIGAYASTHPGTVRSVFDWVMMFL